MKKSVTTLADIAKITGVSKSTVSRALNDSPLISDKVKKKIVRIAADHNFQFNQPARNLSRNKTETIAFLIPRYQDDKGYPVRPFHMEILRGVIAGATKHGYTLVVAESNYNNWIDLNRYIISNQADGLIVISSDPFDDTTSELIKRNIDFVAWGIPENSGYGTVNVNNTKGGQIATNHLLDRGCRNLAFLGSDIDDFETIMRHLGCDHTLNERGVALKQENIKYGFHNEESGYKNMKEVLANDDSVDGVFCCSDAIAVGAIEAIQSIGKRVPEDIAVIGFGDFPVAKCTAPTITTIAQDICLSGERLVDNLIYQLNNKGEYKHSTVPVSLVKRESA